MPSAASAGRPPRHKPHNHAGLEADANSDTNASATRPPGVRWRPPSPDQTETAGLSAGQEGTMKTSRTKKSPTPTPAKVTGTELLMKTPKGSGPSVAPSLEERVAALEQREHDRTIELAMTLINLSAEVANTLQAFAEGAADAVAALASKIAAGGSARTREAYSEYLDDQEAFLVKWRKAHGEEVRS